MDPTKSSSDHLTTDCSGTSSTCSHDNGSAIWTESDEMTSSAMNSWMLTIIVLYVIVCCFGIVTNGLVIYVIIVASKAVTVTNIYILNLAISDFLFLAGVPFTVVTAVARMWIFGGTMCKIFWVTTSINWFTSIYTLTILSADRYFAICHAFWSIPYRTPTVARLVCLGVWTVSFVVMFPIIVYGKTVDAGGGRESCTVEWPENSQEVDPYHVFVGYSFSLGFALPIGLITVFYSLVVLRLKGVGPNGGTIKRSSRSQQAQTRVTLMVTMVTAVNVICWLPYWIFQLVFLFAKHELPHALVLAYQLVTVMNYANSAMNPVLYAFLSDSFLKSLRLAFNRCSCCCHSRLFSAADQGRNGATTATSKGHGGLLLPGSVPGDQRAPRGQRREFETAVVEGGGQTCSVVLASEAVKLGRGVRGMSEQEEIQMTALRNGKETGKEEDSLTSE